LWGGWALEKEKRQWQKDTLANVYSWLEINPILHTFTNFSI